MKLGRTSKAPNARASRSHKGHTDFWEQLILDLPILTNLNQPLMLPLMLPGQKSLLKSSTPLATKTTNKRSLTFMEGPDNPGMEDKIEVRFLISFITIRTQDQDCIISHTELLVTILNGIRWSPTDNKKSVDSPDETARLPLLEPPKGTNYNNWNQ